MGSRAFASLASSAFHHIYGQSPGSAEAISDVIGVARGDTGDVAVVSWQDDETTASAVLFALSKCRGDSTKIVLLKPVHKRSESDERDRFQPWLVSHLPLFEIDMLVWRGGNDISSWECFEYSVDKKLYKTELVSDQRLNRWDQEVDLQTVRYRDGWTLDYLGLPLASLGLRDDSMSIGASVRDEQARELAWGEHYDRREELSKLLRLAKEWRTFGSFHPLAIESQHRWLRSLLAKKPHILGAVSFEVLEHGGMRETSRRCYGVADYGNGQRGIVAVLVGPDPLASLELAGVICLAREQGMIAMTDGGVLVSPARDRTRSVEEFLYRSSLPMRWLTVSDEWQEVCEVVSDASR